MFISRKVFTELLNRVDLLEEYTSRDYDRLKDHDKRIDSLDRAVGEDTQNHDRMSRLIELYYGRKPGPALSLNRRVNQIMDHVGLEVRHTTESLEVVKKSQPAIKKPVTKKKGAK